MKNLVIERLRAAVEDAYPPGQTTVRTVDLEWLLDAHTEQARVIRIATAEADLAARAEDLAT
jgi:hypothetical protein